MKVSLKSHRLSGAQVLYWKYADLQNQNLQIALIILI